MIATYMVSKTLLFGGPINYRISHGIDNKLNEIKHSAQLVTLSAQRLAYGSMPLELAETRPRSNFLESRNAFSKVRSAKLNTDVKILMPGTDYFGETALKQDIIYLSTPCGNHTIRHFRCTGSGLHSNLKGHCHAIWQLYKQPEGVFASVEFQN